MRRFLIGAAVAMALGSTVYSAVLEQPVTYRTGDTVMKGYIVFDDASPSRRPGIVVVHEWWGITQHVHDEARRLAG